MPSKKKWNYRLWFTISQCESASTKGTQQHAHTQILILSLSLPSCILHLYIYKKNIKKTHTHRHTEEQIKKILTMLASGNEQCQCNACI